MVREIAVDSGVPIEYNSEAAEIDEDTTTVKLADGREIQADLIVGADGLNSVVREKIIGEPSTHVHGVFSNFS